MSDWMRGFRLQRFLLVSLWLGLLALGPGAWVHESRPAYLEINETTPGRYDVLWRAPLLSGMRLPVSLRFPDAVRNVTEPAVQELPDSLIERRLIEAGSSGLAGKRIEFVGLQATITDVLVRVQLRDGRDSTTLVNPSQPWVEIAVSQGPLSVAGAYVLHGIQHISFGVDHLLFVLGLLNGGLNGTELAQTHASGQVAAGVATALFVVVSLLAGQAAAVRASWSRVAVRVAGSWIAAIGLFMLGWSVLGA
jgi:hypothetical protein